MAEPATPVAVGPDQPIHRERARFLAHYAKQYAAGAFATPGAKELFGFHVIDSGPGPDRTLVALRRLTRPSRRRDWTGARYLLPDGALVAYHVARAPSAPAPEMTADFVYTHPEDDVLSDGLRSQGFAPFAVHITPASEILTCWHRGPERRYDTVDLVTVHCRPLDISADVREAALVELQGLDGWDDDYPYYSDGSWSALSLKGFWDDPGQSLKPAEMGKAWWAEHPDAADRECRWTTLAEKVPTLTRLAHLVPHAAGHERVRLMRMTRGRLGRHTDIGDKSAGTADGSVARFHIPLVTHPDTVMHTWTLDGQRITVHLEPWKLWYLDQRKPHAVDNLSDVDRVHLVVDVHCDTAVRKTIAP